MKNAELDFRFVRDLLSHLNTIGPYQFYIDRPDHKIIEINLAGSTVSVEDVESALISIMFATKRLGLADDTKRFLNGYRNRRGLSLSLSDIGSLERLLMISGPDEAEAKNSELAWEQPQRRKNHQPHKNVHHNTRRSHPCSTTKDSSYKKKDRNSGDVNREKPETPFTHEYGDADKQLQEALRLLG
ncbi:hypothetical protein [Candidatus Sororendozoicomonas aggregata]|uniref:hypothetical protein n=1 Tax=Candidatus Sororendozoicomonas aggregata TaxID=3073239 RepID=UPI002ED4E2C7